MFILLDCYDYERIDNNTLRETKTILLFGKIKIYQKIKEIKKKKEKR